jgi:hypothetical protein
MRKFQDELITAMLEVMNIPKSGYVVDSLREKLSDLNPKHFTEVMKNLMDNQDRYAKPIEKVSTAIQKALDRYIAPKTVDELLGLFKRSFKGRVITDECDGWIKGCKLAVSADGEHIINLYSGTKLNEADTVSVIDWCLRNTGKIGVVNGYDVEIPISKLGSAYGDVVEIKEIDQNTTALIASAIKRG